MGVRERNFEPYLVIEVIVIKSILTASLVKQLLTLLESSISQCTNCVNS